ncbi:MAG: N-acyl homoserine lactonase family protein [Thermodesulfobacteriota bacterium]|jgi:glyoxylase-like metal-dependent hydrolase (beta-lactamase superfamily II)
MKLYVLDCGKVHVPDTNHLTPERNVGIPITIPISMFVIDHPKGLVLFDTGPIIEHWPDSMLKDVETKPEQRADRQLIKLGYKPEDVKYVVISHMHLDHTEGMTLFPEATFIVRKRELRAAWWPESFEGGYVFNDYKDTRAYKYMQPRDDEEVDLFFDGSLVCIDTKGHTQGHQSMIVTLPKSGKIVLTGDAAQIASNLSEGLLPGICWDGEFAARAIEKLQHMKREGMLIICGHDPVSWNDLKIAPDYYE